MFIDTCKGLSKTFKSIIMKTTHTPGLWVVLSEPNEFIISAGDSEIQIDIAQINPFHECTTAEAKANAKLISIAPEMIKTLINIRQWYEENHQHYVGEETPVVFSEVLSIIQKATIWQHY